MKRKNLAFYFVLSSMIPAWRPDKAMNIEKPDFAEYMNKLGEVAGVTLTTFQDMVDALQKRPDHYTIRAGRNLPDKEFRYLRTVIVTAAVYRGFNSRLLSR